MKATPLELSPQFVNIFETVFFVFFCVTVPLYIFIIFILLKSQRKTHSDLATPFFQIFIVSSIIDLVTLLNNYFGAVFPRWGWWTSVYIWMGRPYLALYFYIAWATGICQAISVSILATNRLYAMMFPEMYKKAWMGWRLRIAIGLQFIPGMVVSTLNLISEVELEPTSDGKGVLPKISIKTVSKFYFTVGGGFLFINCVYLICAYCYLYFILRKRHAHQIAMGSGHRVDRTRSEAKRREHRLFLMSTSIVIVQLTILGFFGTFIFPWVSLEIEQFYLFYSALSDFYSGSNPYFMLIFSDALRKAIYDVVACKTVDSPIQSIVSRHQRSQTPNVSPSLRQS